MFRIYQAVIVIVFGFFSSESFANDFSVRLGPQGNGMRIVFDGGAPLNAGVYLGDNNHTLLVNTLNGTLKPPPKGKGLIQEITSEPIGTGKSQVMFKASKPLRVAKKFHLPASDQNPKHRFVIDVVPDQNGLVPGRLEAPSLPKVTLPTTAHTSAPQPSKKTIIIDAGHGGPDPGAIGVTGTKEKDITLKYAKALAAALQKKGLYHVVLTRDKDVFISLGQRVKIGRMKKGDLFISLHADSSPRRDTRGLSIYTLSKVASDREAARLAAKENKADLFFGIDFDAEIPEVANILIDLTKRETMNLSVTLAQTLKNTLKPRLRLLDNTHRFANFAVLRTPDIPAVLIELGYLSNAADERMLKSTAYLNKVCAGIVDAIEAYHREQG